MTENGDAFVPGLGDAHGLGGGVGVEDEVGSSADVTFEHERLDVYRVARELVVEVNQLMKRNMSRNLREQLDRSSTSILFNIAEGAGKTARAEKQRYYEIARGSATETAAQLDVLELRGVITRDQYRTARNLLVRVVQMLSRRTSGPKQH